MAAASTRVASWSVENSTIQDNTAAVHGGGVKVGGGSASFTSATVTSNRAAGHGGGIKTANGAADGRG